MHDAIGWPLVVSVVLASATWLYQKAWDRAEERRARYETILANLAAFTEPADPDGIDLILSEQRRLLLTAPERVNAAFASFIDAVRVATPDAIRIELLNALVKSMREDSSLLAALRPRLPEAGVTQLTLQRANRPSE